MRALVRLAGLLVIAFGLVACGGGGDEGPSADEQAFGQQLSQGIRAISGQMAAVVSCGEDIACLKQAGQPLADAAEDQIAIIEPGAADLEEGCLPDASDQMVRFLRTARAIGLAAAAGDVDTVSSAADQLNRLDRQVLDSIADCVPGGADNPDLDAARSLQDVADELQQVGTRLAACQDFTCISDEGLALQQTADEGAATLEGFQSEGVSTCTATVLDSFTQALRSYSSAGAALQEGDESAAEQALLEGQGLEAQALRDLSAC